MVQFVNIREFKLHTETVMRRLDRSDVILTIRGRPKALLHKISERDLSVAEEFTPEEWNKLERLAKKPAGEYQSGAEFLKSLKRL
mgnify:CR=1 FL=1